MTDPKGQQPAHPHDDGSDAPMYANEPDEAPAPGSAAGPSAGAQPAAAAGAGAGAAASPAGPPDAEVAQLRFELELAREELAAAQAKAVANHEQYLRASAEMENVRRRAQDDVSKAHKYAVESFAESMLPVRDSLEMALTVKAPSIESLREGVEATLRQLTQAFDRHRLLVIDPLHQKFDPNQHQAISMVPSAEVAANHVVAVLQKGYLINDRVLRPALVTVSQPG